MHAMLHQVRLQPDDAYAVIDALNRDSDALCDMGIMDYRLVGAGVGTRVCERACVSESVCECFYVCVCVCVCVRKRVCISQCVGIRVSAV